MEAHYGKTVSTGSKCTGNIATGNEACVVNEYYVAALPLLHSVTEGRS